MTEELKDKVIFYLNHLRKEKKQAAKIAKSLLRNIDDNDKEKEEAEKFYFALMDNVRDISQTILEVKEDECSNCN